jgi:hypothetical protein
MELIHLSNLILDWIVTLNPFQKLCVHLLQKCVCARARVRACVRVCVCVCVIMVFKY